MFQIDGYDSYKLDTPPRLEPVEEMECPSCDEIDILDADYGVCARCVKNQIYTDPPPDDDRPDDDDPDATPIVTGDDPDAADLPEPDRELGGES